MGKIKIGKGKVSSEKERSLGEGCWYEGMTHKQLWNELAVAVFPHGPQQRKQKKTH